MSAGAAKTPTPRDSAIALTDGAIAARRQRQPMVVIDVTGRCNLRCEHCWNVDYLGEELSAAAIRAIIDQIAAPARVHFLGGEPLLHPAIDELVRYAAARGHKPSLVTNGVGLLEFGLERLFAAGPAEITVSVDGPDAAVHDAIRGPGAFERTWAALEQLSRYIVERRPATLLGISVTMLPSNVAHIPRLFDRLGQAGLFIDVIALGAGAEAGRTLRDGRIEREQKRQITPEVWLATCEAALARFREHPRLQQISLRATPRVHAYLLRQHGVYLYDSLLFCSALEAPFGGRVCADGKLYSCHRDFVIERAKRAGDLPLEGRPYGERIAAGDALFAQRGFRELLEPKLQSPPGAAICQGCHYRHGCIQCPILTHLGVQRANVLCEAVERREAQLAAARDGSAPVAAPPPSESEALDADRPLALVDDVYHREARDGTVTVLSVSRDRATVVPAALHGQRLLAVARAGQTLRQARVAIGRDFGVSPRQLDALADELARQGLLQQLDGDHAL